VVFPPFVLTECLISEELVFTYNRAVYHPVAHQPCPVSPVCHNCIESELKGVKPSRKGLALGGGLGW